MRVKKLIDLKMDRIVVKRPYSIKLKWKEKAKYNLIFLEYGEW